MKKVIPLFLILVAMCMVLGACACEHQYEEKITTEASCTAVGVKTFTCTKCSESYTEEIPMVAHTYTSEVTKEATCAEKGVTTFTCSVCQDSYTEEIDFVEHKFGEETITKEPTCIAEGEKTATCTVCGATEVSGKVAKVDHAYKSKVKVAATCTDKGVNTLTCSVCGDAKEEQVKALGHKYKQSKVITKVTCTSNGEVTMTCSRCKDSYNETKKATGHSWVDASCTKAKHCIECEKTEGVALGHNYNSDGICAICGQSNLIVETEIPYTIMFEDYRIRITTCNLTSTETYESNKIVLKISFAATFENNDGSNTRRNAMILVAIYDEHGDRVGRKYLRFTGEGGNSYWYQSDLLTLPSGAYSIKIFDSL